MRKNHHLHGKCLQQLNLSTTPICLEGLRSRGDDRPLKIKPVDYLTWGPLMLEWKQDYCRVTTSSDYKLKAPLTFCLQAKKAQNLPTYSNCKHKDETP